VSTHESERNELVQVLVTIGIAVATLAIAAVGFLHARANSHATEAGQASDRYSVLTMSSLLQSQENAKVSYEEYVHAQDQRGQAGNALQQSVFSSPSDRELLALVQERWQRLAARTQALTALTPNSPDAQDPQFPRHYFARSTADALRYQALQDIANHSNSAWEGRAAKYVAILTLLAVSLYLFGFGVALPHRVLRLFGTVGGLLLVVGVVWAAVVWAGSPKEVGNEAAAEYSQGEVALETSTIGRDAAGFQSAISHFTTAIHRWPGFARAYLGRANATLASAPLVQASLIPPDALRSVIRDLKRARSLGLGSGLLLEQLSGAEYALALHGDTHLYRRAADDARAAIALVPGDPVAHYTLAIALLGADDTKGADAAYEEAVRRTIALKAPPLEEQLVAGALSDLEALRAAQPDRGSDIDREKGYVVGSVAAGTPTQPSGDARFGTVQAQALPTSTAWAAQSAAGYDPAKDVLSVQWYTRQRGGPWIGIAEPSGPVDPRVEPTVPRYSTRNVTSSSVPARCLGAGDYRVELYVNGHLAGQAETKAAFADLVPTIDRTLNLEVCHPADWKVSNHSLPGFRAGLVSPDGARGVYLVRYDLSLLPARLRGLPTDQITAGLLQSTLATAPYLLPGKVTKRSALQHQASLGLPGSTQQSFAYGSGLAFGQASIDPRDKAAFVTLVFGPRSSFVPPSGDLLPVVGSLSEYRFGG
jgi:tetratricopeptide (TPR) repeat protein